MPPLPSDYIYGSETEGGGFEHLPPPNPAPAPTQPAAQTRSEQATSQAGAQTKTTGGTGGTAKGASTSSGNAPRWIYAVNTPGDPDWGQMQRDGTGLVIASNDPQADEWARKAREHGVPLAVNVAATAGETPQQYAQEVAAAKNKWNPDLLVLDVEGPGKGWAPGDPRYDPTRDGWNWSQTAAPLVSAAAGNTHTVVTMEPQQDDYNYGAWTGIGSNVWVQAYHGDMSEVNPDAVRAQVIRNGVDPSRVSVIVGPGQNPGSGSWVGYGYGPQRQTGGTGRPPGGTPPPTTQPPPATQPGNDPGTIPGPDTGPSHDPSLDEAAWIQRYFGGMGLPQADIDEIDKIFKKYSDTAQAAQAALAYIRGTAWYTEHFPGITYGIQRGLFEDEVGYRNYLSQVNLLSQQYWRRDVSSSELIAYLTAGYGVQRVGQEYATLANIVGSGTDYNYYLGAFGGGEPNPTEMLALGQGAASLDSPLAQQMRRRLDESITRYQVLFGKSQAAQPALSLSGGKLSAPSLGRGDVPDIPA